MTHTPRTLTVQLPAAVATIALPPCECAACAMERVAERPDTDSVRGGEALPVLDYLHRDTLSALPVRGSQYARPLDASLSAQAPSIYGPARVAGGGWVARRRGRCL